MEVEVKDLKKGDEILVSANSNIVFIRILSDPKPHKTRINWYNTVKCQINKIVEKVSYNRRTYKISKFSCRPLLEGEGMIVRKDLNSRKMWLLNRKTE